jgi:hypothetical protein
VAGPRASGGLTTTAHHPFYDRTQAAFVDAANLRVGGYRYQMHVNGSDTEQVWNNAGREIHVDGGPTPGGFIIETKFVGNDSQWAGSPVPRTDGRHALTPSPAVLTEVADVISEVLGRPRTPADALVAHEWAFAPSASGSGQRQVAP